MNLSVVIATTQSKKNAHNAKRGYLQVPEAKILINECYLIDNMEYMATIPDKYFDVIYIDPPYFNIKGDFDFQMSFEEWQEMHEKLAIECNRILKDNGSIILWGHALNIAYQQIIFDKYFNLLNVCVWEKIECQTKRNSIESLRRWAPITERFLFYDKGDDKSGLTMIYSNPNLFEPIKKYMREEKEKIKKDYGFKNEKQFNDFINCATDTRNVVSRHYFSDSQYRFPTEEIYLKLQSIKSGKYFSKEYESLRSEYESLRRPFNPVEEIKYDVIRAIQESNLTRNINHPTQKPPTLVHRIIQAVGSPGCKVFSPFSGGCYERIVCDKLGFEFRGCENNIIFWKMQEARYKTYLQQGDLFDTDEYQKIIYEQHDL